MKRAASSPLAHCTDLVRSLDRPRYLAGLLLRDPRERHAHFALRALNLELASVVAAVTSA